MMAKPSSFGGELMSCALANAAYRCRIPILISVAETIRRWIPLPELGSAARLQSKQVRQAYSAVETFVCATFFLTGREHSAVGWRRSSAASPHSVTRLPAQ